MIEASFRRSIDDLEHKVAELIMYRHDISLMEYVLDVPSDKCFGKI